MFEQPLSAQNSRNVFKDRLAILEEEESNYTSPKISRGYSERPNSRYRNFNPMDSSY